MSDSEDRQLGQYIPLHYHYQMLLDRARVDGFAEALDACVPEGGRVLEFGGGTGVLSFLAARRAAKVWCVERNGELVQAAKRLLARNGVAARIEVVHADAREYLPPEPVDVVVCEMLHVALLREKQIEVLASFKDRYARRFGTLPRFVPEATILAVQPVYCDFAFSGYDAPVPLFVDPLGPQDRITELAAPLVYATIDYQQALPSRFAWQGTAAVSTAGGLNALRFVTKNLLAILTDEGRAVAWHNQYLVLPTPETVPIVPGDAAHVAFAYEPGGSIASLADHIEVSVTAGAAPEIAATQASPPPSAWVRE
jgi:predicted RNA methylase